MWMNERWSRARASIWSRLLDQRKKRGKTACSHIILSLYTLTSASSPWRLLLYHTAYLIGLMLIPSLQYIVQPLWIYTVFYIPATSIWRYARAVRAYHCCLQKAWFSGVRGFAYMKMYWYRKPLKGVIFIWAQVHLAVEVSISQMTVWMDQYQTAYWTDGVKNIRDCTCVTDVTVFQWNKRNHLLRVVSALKLLVWLLYATCRCAEPLTAGESGGLSALLSLKMAAYSYYTESNKDWKINPCLTGKFWNNNRD